MSRIWTRQNSGAVVTLLIQGRLNKQKKHKAKLVHHNVCRLEVGGVESNVQRLDSDLDRRRSINEDSAGVVRVRCCRILKDPTWGKELNITICRVKTFYLWQIKSRTLESLNTILCNGQEMTEPKNGSYLLSMF